jgi:hypothetical protein
MHPAAYDLGVGEIIPEARRCSREDLFGYATRELKQLGASVIGLPMSSWLPFRLVQASHSGGQDSAIACIAKAGRIALAAVRTTPNHRP